MTELERKLLALAPAVEFPPVPDLGSAVRPRLGARPWRPRPLVVALAAALVAFAAALAVPSARSTLLRWFHISGATVERVQTLPPARERGLTQGLGRAMTLTAAQHQAGFRLALPPNAPRRAYVLDGHVVSVVLPGRVVLTEFRSGAEGLGILKKVVSGGTRVSYTRVDGADGLWIEGGAHTFAYVDPVRGYRQRTVKTRGNVLLWTKYGLTLRLAGRISRAEALRIAATVNPS